VLGAGAFARVSAVADGLLAFLDQLADALPALVAELGVPLGPELLLARLAAEAAHMPALAAIARVVDELQRQTAERSAHQQLENLLATLGEDLNGHEARAGLLALRGLSQFSGHDAANGGVTLAALAAEYGDTPFPALIATNALYVPCPQCDGAGRVRSLEQFLTRAPASICGACGGTGLVISEKEARRQYDAVVDRLLETLASVPGGGWDLAPLKSPLSLEEARRRYCNPARPLGDQLLRLAARRPEWRLALDPEALPLLTTPAPAALAAATNAVALEAALQMTRVHPPLLLRAAPPAADDTNTVALLSAAPLWDHALACRELATQQLPRAWQALRESASDDSPAGRRARRLSQLILAVYSNRLEQAKWEDRVGSSLLRQPEVRRAAVEALRNLRVRGVELATAVGDAVETDADRGHAGESLWLLSATLDLETARRALAAKLALSGATPEAADAPLPEAWPALRQRLEQAASLSARRPREIDAADASADAATIAERARVAAAAYALDRDNLCARAACGYWSTREALAAAHFPAIAPAALAETCRADGKAALLRAAQTLAGQKFAVAEEPARPVGVAAWIGMDLASGEARVQTLTARFVAGEGRVAVRYDGALAAPWRAAARDAGAWLAAFGGARFSNQCLRVTVASSAATLNADSAAFALALSAMAAANGRPLRGDVVVAGDLATNGALRGVYAAAARVRAAAALRGVEIIVLPAANEPDLALLPPATLCRCAVVLADDAAAAARYAQGPHYQHRALAALRQAQALILTGAWDKAQPLLLEAASQAPELFTARRLLQLNALWRADGA
jgi:hypothetical protein